MTDDTYDLLRRALVQILGPRPTPERRRQIAADLRSLAEQQDRLASARAAERQPSEQSERAPSRRPAGAYVRIGYDPDPQTGARRVRLSLGRQCWLDFGAPEQIDVQRVGSEIWIVPLSGKLGYHLSVSMGSPSCIIADTAPLAQFAPGRYAASIRAGALVVGERIA